MSTKFWIEKNWGKSVNNATSRETNLAIEEISKVSKEQGAFWVGHIDKKYVLEIHKDLNLFLIYGENQDKKIQTKFVNWDECRHFLDMYFAKDFLRLKNKIKLNAFSNS
ncbi:MULTISPECIES: hypothetical protein [unclassified Flavobacterium]|uniref:hypothetical protein n=1 Tax=unclassified Flavobacterium TaxID=196869 RepID=UPI00057E812C|nr:MULTISPECIES: hypothetical protein [unclassified Flavobacterium]KIA95645.1 hypothetical protein OA93_18015 [Flavobacterium sp. KMS]OUL62824.1 hypothetical protein B8T70_08225 [Flavobacterium sp. AJR]